ncbi:conserved hypothetical protein [Rhodopseudomonas palustris HaA2]|uniref:Uncharacterized protein n=1 Tax=Rhodopseudomonas palustris (strain HaA2) TaxID=316058 RepID=Q2IU22_RHOP2|nr:hypothetical protein [Rhodopseudomonas palustris]ABD08288.1 conserved hypothetical protein [Rhodopseudomonas palustris HaA2]
MTMLDDDTVQSRKWHSGFGGFLLRDWPYILMLLLSLGGVAYTSFTQTELYWLLLTPFVGLVCVITRWPHVEGRDEHLHLIVSQALHWAAVLVAMELMSLQVLRQVTGLASPLSVLTLLALGTFTAGLHIRSWKVCAVGAILGVSVPAVALLQQSALLILLVVAVVVAIAVPFFWARSREPVGPSHPLYEAPTTANAPVTAPPAAAAPVSQTPLFEPPVATPAAPQPPFYEPAPPPTGVAPPAAVATEPTSDVEPEQSDRVAKPDAQEPPADGEPPGNVRNIFAGR